MDKQKHIPTKGLKVLRRTFERLLCPKAGFTMFDLAQMKPLKLLVVSFVFFSLSACVPKDQRLPAGTASSPGGVSRVYSGFTGALSAQTLSDTRVKLTWSAATDFNVIAYNIYDTSMLFNPKLIATVVGISSTSYSIPNLTPETYYHFRVRATTAANIEDTNTVDLPAITYAGVVGGVVQSSTSALITFNDATNASAIHVYCKSGSSATYSEMPESPITDVTKKSVLLGSQVPLVGGTQYTCRVAIDMNSYFNNTLFVDNNLATTTFTPMGKATHLVFKPQPGSAAAGSLLNPEPVVYMEDVNGNIVSAGPDANVNITLTISTNSPSTGAVRGTYKVQAVNGVATFTNLFIKEAGIKIITATKDDTSGDPSNFGSGPMPTDSNSFTISAGAVDYHNSSIQVTPAGPLIANGNASYTVSMILQDQFGNPVPGVIPNFASTNNNDILSQPTIVSDLNGTATGTISTTVVGGSQNNGVRTLNITSPSGLTTDTTNATFIPGPASQLVFTAQPQTSPAGNGGMTSNVVISIEDANGNLVSSTDPTAGTGVNLLISSAPGAGVLSGNTQVNAINGVATFTGLGINLTGTGYKLKGVAPAYTTLTQTNSYPFNITASNPTKIIFGAGAPTSLISSSSGSGSGICGTYSLILTDGVNATNATTSTTMILSSTGSAIFYNSSNCSGSAIAAFTIQPGHNSGTISMRDPAAEAISIGAAASGLTTASVSVNVSPSQFLLSGGPISTLSGVCSPAFTLTTQGANNNSGNVFADTNFQFSFLNSGNPSNAIAYSDSLCANSLGVTPATATVKNGKSAQTIYFMDNTAEGPITLTVGAQNNMISVTPAPAVETLTVLGSKLTVTPPANTHIIAGGTCIGPFQIKALDTNNNVAVSANLTLAINGSTATTRFYNSAACSSAISSLSLTAGQANLYIYDSKVENLSITLADPTAAPLKLAATPAIALEVRPYQLAWTSPSGGTAINTGPLPTATNIPNVCLAMTVASQYSSSTNVIPLSPITVKLNGAGVETTTGASYFSDSACTNAISQIAISGTATATFYFMTINPGTYGLTASDNAGVINTSSSITITANPASAWIGSRSANGPIGPSYSVAFAAPGQSVITPTQDGPIGVQNLHFDSTKQYLFVIDRIGNRVFKYDYLNGKYMGWIGLFNNTGPAIYDGASGCLNTTANGAPTPGWCFGGTATAVTSAGSGVGGFAGPSAMTDDGYNLYVTNSFQGSVQMYNMTTGHFEGWIGGVNSTTGITAGVAASAANPLGATLANNCAGGSTSGLVTPGFCAGGSNALNSTAHSGDGLMVGVSPILWDHNVLYVGVLGGVLKFDGTPGSPTQGQFQGWIGWVGSVTGTSTNLDCGPYGAGAANQRTPGWCTGGLNANSSNPGGITNPSGLYADYDNDWLYVVDSFSSNNRIQRFHISTGAYDLGSGSSGYVSPQQIVSDATNGNQASTLYLADWQRIVKLDTSAAMTGWVGKVSGTQPTQPAACQTLLANGNTPGWCQNGSSGPGMDERAFNTATAIEYDGNGFLLTGQSEFPAIKKWNANSGQYVGQLALTAVSPTQWTTTTETATGGGFDDVSMNQPAGMVVDAANSLLYLAEYGSQRIKKISTATGQVLGWIGAVTTLPTGGASQCTIPGNVTAMTFSGFWCLGGLVNPLMYWSLTPFVNMVSQTAQGSMFGPSGLTMDSNYIYVTDLNYNRIQRYDLTGAYKGWIGYMSSNSGVQACGGSIPANGTFTGNWCYGGTPGPSYIDGALNKPTAITHSGGYLYVVDQNNERISRYSVGGTFLGWIGRTTATSCATTGSSLNANRISDNTVVSTLATNGWCLGGTGVPAYLGSNSDPGGGFNWGHYSGSVSGLAADSTYLYVLNDQNQRIDRFYLNSGSGYNAGTWKDAIKADYSSATLFVSTGWPSGSGTTESSGLYVDSAGGYFYYGYQNQAVVKRRISDGQLMGWKGAYVGSTTPSSSGGWWTSGTPAGSTVFGGFYGYIYLGPLGNYITGDTNFIYVSDPVNHRVTRLAK
jgi:hypothetical protein